jgi:hypothetical protein
MEFCEWYLIMHEAAAHFVGNVGWADQAIFITKKRVNRHNFMYWSDGLGQNMI